jgi:hypothetical protein
MIPISSIRTIPIPSVEKDVEKIYIRTVVDACPRYNYQLRRCRKYKNWW